MVAGRAWTIVDDAPCSNIIDPGCESWEFARMRVLVLGTNELTGLAVAAEFAVAGWDVRRCRSGWCGRGVGVGTGEDEEDLTASSGAHPPGG